MNWGYKILIVFILFGGMIGYMVYRSFNTNFELVESDYYNKELRYQQVIDGTHRANALTGDVAFSQDGKHITLQLPGDTVSTTVTGNVWFYCAYDATRDKQMSLSSLTSSTNVLPGNYTVKVNWNHEGKEYYAEKTLTVH